ncbi:MAG: hypothetical protein WC880_04835 [Candidatus Paceibacterota bacterium]
MQMLIDPDRARRFTIGVKFGFRIYIFFNIIFHSDGSMFVNFPYYKHSKGIVSLVTHKKGEHEQTLELNPGGRVVSHKVKYSHHPDGEAHFSQDGRVMTVIRKKSLRLDKIEGHMFSVQLQGISNFDSIDVRQVDAKRLNTIKTFERGLLIPRALEITGKWYTLEGLVALRGGETLIPIAPPIGNPLDDHVLLLACGENSILTKQDDTVLIFIAGFDSAQAIFDPDVETTLLAFVYPNPLFDKMKEMIGSADYLG